jgi:hypothetical protein
MNESPLLSEVEDSQSQYILTVFDTYIGISKLDEDEETKIKYRKELQDHVLDSYYEGLLEDHIYFRYSDELKYVIACGDLYRIAAR